MILRPLIVVLAFALAGCGPLAIPAVQRLCPEEQAEVDASWNNMLAPPGRLDRQTLLDTLTCFQLHERGVNTLTMRSEKAFHGGTVVMEIHFDRGEELRDRFEIRIYDHQWKLVRAEQYPAEEVRQAIDSLFGQTWVPRGKDGEELQLTPEALERERRREERMKRVAAATQPAGR